MRNKNIIGTGVALITPFNEDLTIDYNSLGCLIEDLILNHIDYFVILGTTAETSNLSLEEQDEVIAYIQEIVNGRIPLVLGVGGNSTRDVVSRIDSLDFSSFEAILSVVPYYNKPTQNGLIAHYSAISEACPVDVILYNVPSRSSLNMEVDTIVMLAKKCSNIIGIKEASGDMSQCMSLLNLCPRDFMVISGDDKMTFPIMALGGAGVISVQAMYFPALFSQMINFIRMGNINEARECHFKLLESVDMFYIEGNPAGVKQSLFYKGVIKSNQLRLPLMKMSQANAEKFTLLLNRNDM